MTLQLDLKPETEQSLRAAAEARHIPVEDYVLFIVEGAITGQDSAASGQNSCEPAQDLPPVGPAGILGRESVESREEFERWLNSLGRFSHLIPKYPAGFWTRDIVSNDDRG